MTSASFPGALDSLANPGPTTETDDAGYELDIVVSRLQNCIMAIEAKVGTGVSTPGASAGVLRRIGTGTTAWDTVHAGDLAPGAVATADLAANAATQVRSSAGSSGAQTISPGPATLNEMAITFTPTGVPCLLIFSGTFFTSVAATITVYYYKDNVSQGIQRAMTTPNGSTYVTITLTHVFTPTTANQAFQIYVGVSTGSVTADGNNRHLTIVEFKR